MNVETLPRVNKLWFIIGDGLLLGLAAFFCCLGTTGPLNASLAWGSVAAVALGAWLGVAPWIMEYRALLKMEESDHLVSAVARIQNLETVAQQIGAATSQWQAVQEQAQQTAQKAGQIADQITAEAKSFGEFLEKADSSEKAALRLEVEKLHRAESEWLQVCVRMLDHVFALHQAALRSGQQKVIEQLTQFQNACRDVTRRVGLNAFVAAPDAPFDTRLHRLVDEKTTPGADAKIEGTLAPGFTLRGDVVRQALVKVREPGADPEPEEEFDDEANIVEISPIPTTTSEATESDQDEPQRDLI